MKYAIWKKLKSSQPIDLDDEWMLSIILKNETDITNLQGTNLTECGLFAI